MKMSSSPINRKLNSTYQAVVLNPGYALESAEERLKSPGSMSENPD